MIMKSGASTISAHVLDAGLGVPARGIAVMLEQVQGDGGATAMGVGTTDDDGRVADLLPPGVALRKGTYRLHFDTATYFAAARRETFYPEVTVVFRVTADVQHYHVALLLSPFGYTTYRGS